MTENRFIVSLDENDLNEVVAIERACYSKPWSVDQFKQELNNPVAFVDGCKIGNQLAGYICYWLVAEEMQVLNVAVARACRRRGIGRLLLNHAVHRCVKNGLSTAWLEVRAGNFSAIALYQHYGFQVDGVRRGYYNDGEDALLMFMAFDH